MDDCIGKEKNTNKTIYRIINNILFTATDPISSKQHGDTNLPVVAVFVEFL